MKTQSLRFLLWILSFSCVISITLSCSVEFINNLKPGVRVKRGPHWKWGNQDGGIHSLGTVVDKRTANGWVSVRWDNGHSNLYRVGFQNSCDLIIVGNNDTKCAMQAQNDTLHTTLIIPKEKMPLMSGHQYCQSKLISTSSDKIVSFTLLWYMKDSCNITVYEGSSNEGEKYGNACQNEIGTYHSRNNSLYVEFFLKDETKTSRFIASYRSEEPECKESYNKFINGGDSGYIQPPYSNITLITPLKCQWTLTTNTSHVFEINLVKFQELMYLDVYDGNTQIEHLNEKNHRYTTKSSMLDIFYNKPNVFSSGFVITYKSIPKEKTSCPEDREYKHPGIRDQFIVSTELGNSGLMQDYCHFTLGANESTYIELDIQRLHVNSSCLPIYLNMTVNGLSFPFGTDYMNHRASIQSKTIQIQYLKKTRCKYLMAFYIKSVTVPSCFLNPIVDVISGPKRFLDVPQTVPFDLETEQCQWTFQIKPKHILQLEIITTITSVSSTHLPFFYNDGKYWRPLLNGKINTTHTSFKLKYKLKPVYKLWSTSGNMIISYNSVSVNEIPAAEHPDQRSSTTSANTANKEMSSKTPPTSENLKKHCEVVTKIPEWSYILVVLLALICIVLGYFCRILYNRRSYTNTESVLYNRSLLKHENVEL
ncbi:uncharacterized protein LOC115216771 [Argonauta hians]